MAESSRWPYLRGQRVKEAIELCLEVEDPIPTHPIYPSMLPG
jgi:hypothetical protein